MSSLSFLDPSGAEPLARSPLEDGWLAAGARLAERDGWRVAAGYTSEGTERAACSRAVGLADRSHLTKLELQTGPDGAAGLRALVERLSGATPTPGRAEFAAGAWWCPLTPTRLLVLGEPAALRGLALTGQDLAVTVADVTAGFAAVSLLGPRGRDVLARVSALDLRAADTGTLMPGSVARVAGLVVCERRDALLILVGSAHAQYLWETLTDAGTPLGLQPVGLDVVDSLLAPTPADAPAVEGAARA